MTNIVVLNSQTHRTLRVWAGASARYGDAQRFVPVIVGEIPFLAAHYPVLFSKDAETGAFYCGAMLGFDDGENLFLGPDGFGGVYRPLNLQRGPFYTAGDDLAVDLDHPRIGDGEALFSGGGQPTLYLESIFALFRELRPGLEKTKVFIDTLMTLKLVEPIAINVGFDDGTSRELQGLYTVNQEALRNLSDAAVVDLFRRGYLQVMHLMIGSLKQVPVLATRKNRQLLKATEALG